MDTEITFESVSVSEFRPNTSEALSFQHENSVPLCACVGRCTGVYVDVGLGTPASIHLLYKWYLYQSLCFARQYSGEHTEVVPVHSSAGEGGQVVTVQWDKGRILSAPPGRAGKASQRK